MILLRAEANIGLGNVSTAAGDINFIRTTSGAARTDLNASNTAFPIPHAEVNARGGG